MSNDQMPAPGKTKLIKLPPSRARKDIKCPGYAPGGGGMSKLRFDWYITFFTEIEMKHEKSINSMEINESQYSHFSWWLIFIDFLY